MPKTVRALAREAVADAAIVDIHTHLFDPAMGSMLLSGIDELLTYHYLVAEVLRARPDIAPDAFFALARPAQADLVWEELFLRRSPVSEACRGVVTVLDALGVSPRATDLRRARAYFARRPVAARVDRAFELAGLSRVYMTNDLLDPAEAPLWSKGFRRDPRFLGVLRLDRAVMNWPEPVAALRAAGADVDESLSGRTLAGVRDVLDRGCDRLDARYVAISLPPSFAYPDPLSPLTNLMTHAVIPMAERRGLPLALMIGVRKLANPALRLAGDSVGAAPVETVEALARDFPRARFAVTYLSRENQHAFCIAARKFANLLPFGCWWFLNNPTFIREMTSMRLETLGLSFIPQHSDARVLEQVIYKWRHSREIIGDVLAAKYEDLARAGWRATAAEIRRDVTALLGGSLLERR
jgi:hypothetical protein